HISVYIALYPKDCPSTEKPMKRLVAAELGERITVTCQYSKKLSDYSKFFCKVISNNECTRIADSNGAVNEPYKRRVSITHKGKSQVISIISAKEEDAGEYWCGAASGNEVEFTQVKILQISHGKNQEHVVQDYNKNVLKVSIVSLRNEYQVRALRAPGLYPMPSSGHFEVLDKECKFRPRWNHQGGLCGTAIRMTKYSNKSGTELSLVSVVRCFGLEGMFGQVKLALSHDMPSSS
uniref:Ig-like domain-containing protein n=1 Tax=Callorhinchus milii TaxID=7868 RepID=A0A4W3JF70_CALMI